MGVQGLWTILEGRCAQWQMRVEGGRDLVIVDSSGVEYLLLDVGGLDRFDVHTLGRHAQHASCLRS